MAEMIAEKRSSVRQPIDIRVRITLPDEKRSVIFGRGEDISIGGMAIFVATDLNVGERVVIEFVLLSGRQLKLEAIVRNRHSYRYGLAFATLTTEQRSEIERL
ncbi:MAG: PilZ domain-containing protein [Acidobacteriia bacterium]|nr:PilZ domain-containing protein [Terriglobia bacterium]